ncbi:MAG: hypothetical protein P2A85_07585 [Microcoleus anatoxicus]|uniref:hypothetical protein n=2 Tax=Microcoleus anatoxicus TaxID=2705319 RepID=UPI003671198D
MTKDGNDQAESPENQDLNNVDRMAKAFLVSMAWSYAEALEKTQKSQNQQKPAPESQKEQVDSDTESDK